MKNTRNILFFFFLVLFLTQSAYAYDSVDAAMKWNYISCIVIKVLQVASMFIAFMVIVAAGAKYMFSEDPLARIESRNMVVRTCIVLVIILSASEVVNYLAAGTDVGLFDMNVCAGNSSINPVATTSTSTTTSTQATLVVGGNITTTTMPSPCIDTGNECAITRDNACANSGSICRKFTVREEDLEDRTLDIDRVCGGGFADCCCSQGYVLCCPAA